MSPKLELFLTRLLLTVIAADAATLAAAYEDEAQASLCLLAAVAFLGLFTPMTARRDDHDDDQRRKRERP